MSVKYLKGMCATALGCGLVMGNNYYDSEVSGLKLLRGNWDPSMLERRSISPEVRSTAQQESQEALISRRAREWSAVRVLGRNRSRRATRHDPMGADQTRSRRAARRSRRVPTVTVEEQRDEHQHGEEAEIQQQEHQQEQGEQEECPHTGPKVSDYEFPMRNGPHLSAELPEGFRGNPFAKGKMRWAFPAMGCDAPIYRPTVDTAFAAALAQNDSVRQILEGGDANLISLLREHIESHAKKIKGLYYSRYNNSFYAVTKYQEAQPQVTSFEYRWDENLGAYNLSYDGTVSWGTTEIFKSLLEDQHQVVGIINTKTYQKPDGTLGYLNAFTIEEPCDLLEYMSTTARDEERYEHQVMLDRRIVRLCPDRIPRAEGDELERVLEVQQFDVNGGEFDDGTN